MELVFFTLAFGGLIGLPAIVLGFIYLVKKLKYSHESMKVKKEVLELEVEKERLHVEALERENRNLDRMIELKAVEKRFPD